MTQEEPINPTAQDVIPDTTTTEQLPITAETPELEQAPEITIPDIPSVTLESPEDAPSPMVVEPTSDIPPPDAPLMMKEEVTVVPAEEQTPTATESDDASHADKHPGRKEKHSRFKLPLAEFTAVWEELTKAKDAEAIIPVKLKASVRGGAIIEYNGLEGFIPMSHVDLSKNPTEKHIEPLLGQMVDIVVIEMSTFEERRFVGSRKEALKKQRFNSMKKGMVVEGTITSITDYGVFVDLGGIDGLVHISRLSKIRVNHPSELVKFRQHVKVTVVDVDHKKERIALSMKEFTESPWAHVGEKYPTGSTHSGKVRNITSFGVYVQLEPGVDGMAHISDLSWTKRLNSPHDIFKIGDEVQVKVLDVSSEKQRISLSVKEMLPDPWPRLANIYPVDTTAEGTIKLLMPAGAIVELPHDVDAFIPRGKMRSRAKRGKKETTYNIGDVVRVRVVDINVEKHELIVGIDYEEKQSEHRSEKQKEELKQATSDRAFTLGDIAGLREMISSPEKSTPPSAPVVEQVVETSPTEVPVIETPVINLQETTPDVIITPALSEETTESTPVVQVNENSDHQPTTLNTETIEAVVEPSPAEEAVTNEVGTLPLSEEEVINNLAEEQQTSSEDTAIVS